MPSLPPALSLLLISLVRLSDFLNSNSMGALCGKEDHFDALERQSQGNRLGAAPTQPTPASKPATSGAPKAGKSVSTSPPQRLGGNEGGTGDEADARRRMLEAAEARKKAVRHFLANGHREVAEKVLLSGCATRGAVGRQVVEATRRPSQGRREGSGGTGRGGQAGRAARCE